MTSPQHSRGVSSINNLLDGKPILVFKDSYHPSDAIVADDMKSVLTYCGYGDNQVRLWAIDGSANGKEMLRIPGKDWNGATLSPDGKTIAMADRYRIVLWDASNSKQLSEWKESNVRSLQFSADSKRLFYAINKVVKIRNIAGIAEAGKNKQDELRGLLE